jgi:hypothetical protein
VAATSRNNVNADRRSTRSDHDELAYHHESIEARHERQHGGTGPCGWLPRGPGYRGDVSYIEDGIAIVCEIVRQPVHIQRSMGTSSACCMDESAARWAPMRSRRPL